MIEACLLAVVLGVVTGMRSILALALLAWLAPPLDWLSLVWVRGILGAAAVAELVADKLPKTPSRLSPGPLVGRLAIGATVGGLVMIKPHAPIVLGAALGAAAAAAGAFAGNKLRAALGRKTGARDLWFALGEDAIAIAAAVWALLGPLAPGGRS
jgi:uncharacterized membrane protein